MFTTAETFIFDNHFMLFAHIHPAHTDKFITGTQEIFLETEWEDTQLQYECEIRD